MHLVEQPGLRVKGALPVWTKNLGEALIACYTHFTEPLEQLTVNHTTRIFDSKF